jgi:hypothetical protein
MACAGVCVFSTEMLKVSAHTRLSRAESASLVRTGYREALRLNQSRDALRHCATMVSLANYRRD